MYLAGRRGETNPPGGVQQGRGDVPAAPSSGVAVSASDKAGVAASRPVHQQRLRADGQEAHHAAAIMQAR